MTPCFPGVTQLLRAGAGPPLGAPSACCAAAPSSRNGVAAPRLGAHLGRPEQGRGVHWSPATLGSEGPPGQTGPAQGQQPGRAQRACESSATPGRRPEGPAGAGAPQVVVQSLPPTAQASPSHLSPPWPFLPWSLVAAHSLRVPVPIPALLRVFCDPSKSLPSAPQGARLSTVGVPGWPDPEPLHGRGCVCTAPHLPPFTPALWRSRAVQATGDTLFLLFAPPGSPHTTCCP